MSEQLQIEKVFNDVNEHKRVAELILRFSTNKDNIQEIALGRLDLWKYRHILDLGCAFGSFTEKLKGKTAPGATATGVDVIAAYEPLYLAACERAYLQGRFFSSGATILKSIPDKSLDLILCSYALYFFPEAIPEIARLLKNDGAFVAITHHRDNTGELIDLTKKILKTNGFPDQHYLPLEIITKRFSSENGEAMLKPWFGRIEIADFKNELVFSTRDIHYLLEYFRFKSPFYLTNALPEAQGLLPLVLESIRQRADEQGGMIISKNDRIFICFLPRTGEEGP